MSLDINTLFLVTIYVEAMLGLLLLFAWVQNSGIMAVAWWGSAHLLRAASVVLFGMYGSVSDLISIDLANAVLFTAFAVTWTGARVFDGRSPSPLGLFAGAALWLLVCRMPLITESIDARVLISSGIITSYTWLTAYEFWRGRGEPLVSRWPAIFMLFAHGALFLLRTPLSTVLPWSVNAQVFESVWMTVLSFEALLFTIAIAFILLAMAKERTELRHKTAALVDLAHRHRQSPRLHGGRCADGAPARVASQARGRAADRPRPFQADQRHLRSRDRRSCAAGLCRNPRAPTSPPMDLRRAAGRRGIRRAAARLRQGQGRCGGRAASAPTSPCVRSRSTAVRSSQRSSVGVAVCDRARSTSPPCWRKPIRRSTTPRSAGVTASSSPRSISSCGSIPIRRRCGSTRSPRGRAA